ncbi:conjugal transfer protein TraN, partial [Neisseria gonorrhoeae]
MLITSASAAALRESAACTRTSSVCVDGPSTKNINGVDVTKDCWEYKEEYQCLEKDSADYCAPLKDPSAKCEVQGQTCLEQSNEGECLRYTHKYSCDVDLRTLHQGRLPTKVEEMEHTHLISSQWDESSCQVQGKKCKAVAT